MTTERTMREVVARLRAQNSDAVLELAELDNALEEFLKNLEVVATTVRDLHQVTTKVVEHGKAQALAWVTVRDHTAQLSTWVGQLQSAFRETRAAVQGWNIAGEPSESILPTSEQRPIPPNESTGAGAPTNHRIDTKT